MQIYQERLTAGKDRVMRKDSGIQTRAAFLSLNPGMGRDTQGNRFPYTVTFIANARRGRFEANRTPPGSGVHTHSTRERSCAPALMTNIGEDHRTAHGCRKIG